MYRLGTYFPHTATKREAGRQPPRTDKGNGMKPQTEARLTKRQQKALRGPNAAVQRSLNSKDAYEVRRNGANYKGRDPVFRIDPLTGAVVKSLPGIPFVRVSQKRAA